MNPVKGTVVGVGDCAVINDTAGSLVTYALGSCIGLALYDPIRHVGGLLHYMLPECTMDHKKASRNPYMFADTGIPMMLHRCQELGALKSRLMVWAAGGAQVMDEQGFFNIGKRNYVSLRKVLWKCGLMLLAEHIGGSTCRTVRLDLASGRFWIRVPGETEVELRSQRKSSGGILNAVQPVNR